MHWKTAIGPQAFARAPKQPGPGVAAWPTNCDDADATVYPGAEEIPYDGIDQDCDGDDVGDVDGDGYDGGDDGEDCDDADAAINPDAEELCDDAIDNDCDGLVDHDDVDDCEDVGDDDDDTTDEPAADDELDEFTGGCDCRIDAPSNAAPASLLALLTSLILFRRR